MKNKWIAMACGLTFTAFAQIPDYLGPGVLTPGAGNIGERSGEQVDLRFHVDVMALYDNGLVPFSVNSKGELVEVNGLYGFEGMVGAYGTHHWRQAALGLDYAGTFYDYANNSYYDGSTQNLTLGFTYQKSRRVIFDLRQIAGTSSLGYGAPGFYSGSVPVVSDVVTQPTTLLFDNRTYYLQSSADMSYIQSSRTIYTLGGDWYTVQRSAAGLASLKGYMLHGMVTHRISRFHSIGAVYNHVYYDFPPAFGQSTINTGEGFLSGTLGRRWTFSLHGGAFLSDVSGVKQVVLNPVIAAILGQSTVATAFYVSQIEPTGGANLSGRFKTSSITFTGTRTVTPGNGVYLTSETTSGNASYSYTGIHKWNLGLSGGYYKLSSVGQGIQPYSQYTGGAGFTYAIVKWLHLVGRYDYRHQQISSGILNFTGFRASSYRALFGLSISPGNVPLSLW